MSAPVPDFVHLRLHSEYSVTDGIVRIDDAVARAAADGMPALALTDLGESFRLGQVLFRGAREAGSNRSLVRDVWITQRGGPGSAVPLAVAVPQP
jgi:DNA polymerase-3 subunit alpha